MFLLEGNRFVREVNKVFFFVLFGLIKCVCNLVVICVEKGVRWVFILILLSCNNIKINFLFVN